MRDKRAAPSVGLNSHCLPVSPLRVPETQSAFHRLAQRNAFRRRDARQQSRSFARWNQSLKRPAILGVGVTRLSSAMNPKTASNPHHPTLLFANSNQFQTQQAKCEELIELVGAARRKSKSYSKFSRTKRKSALQKKRWPSRIMVA